MDDATTTVADGQTEPNPDAPTYPLVTIALVAHNPGAWFAEVLHSLAAQDYPKLELVVIDAASDIFVPAELCDKLV